MAVQRPNVVVFQEFAEITVVPDIPDLDVLIVGPCYQLIDYLDDKADAYATNYGYTTANSPITPTLPVVLSDPPSIKPGAQLNSDSVKVYLDEAQVQIIAWDHSSNDATYSENASTFIAHTTAAGMDFAAEGVLAGDTLYTNGSGLNDTVRTIKNILFVLHDFTNTIDFVTATIVPGDIVTLTNDNPPGGESRNGVYVVKEVRDDETLVFTGLNWTQNPETSFGGTDTTTITITSSTGAVKVAPVSLELANYSELAVTSDFTENSTAGYKWRIERKVNNILLDPTNVTIIGNQITLDGDIQVDLSNTLLNKVVRYAKIYVEYTALRTDLQNVNTVASASSMLDLLGKYDARNPLHVGAVVAKANTNTSIKVYGIAEDTLTGYLDFIDRISNERQVYAIVPLTYNTSIIAALNNMAVSLADPNYVLTAGIKQKFRSVIGAVELTTQKDLVAAISGGTGQTKDYTAPTSLGNRKLITTWTSTTVPNFSTLGVIPGDRIELIAGVTPVTYTYTVTKLLVVPTMTPTVNAVEVATAVTPVDLTTVGNTLKIYAYDGTLKETFTIAGSGLTGIAVTTATLDNRYLTFHAAGGAFIDSGVVPGDLIQVPTAVTTNDWTTYNTWTIDEVVSNERLTITNTGADTATVAKELPGLFSRVDGTAISNGTVYYRIIRNLTKEEQVLNLIETASSFNSKRTVLCYPDRVDIPDLPDGSKLRTNPNVASQADAQAGYYLACAVGGQTAGLPPQQGFTNYSIAGISRIYNSQDYFKEEHLTEISNGGIYVFTQDNPDALPYSIHEVTTDVSALEFSEYMVTKNFDFIALTFLDSVSGFIGVYNVNPETIENVRLACIQVGNTLRERKVAKIGAPLTDFTVSSVAASVLSADRIEAYVLVDLPMTLNTLAIHLIA
jgi:hypothetical protein